MSKEPQTVRPAAERLAEAMELIGHVVDTLDSHSLFPADVLGRSRLLLAEHEAAERLGIPNEWLDRTAEAVAIDRATWRRESAERLLGSVGHHILSEMTRRGADGSKITPGAANYVRAAFSVVDWLSVYAADPETAEEWVQAVEKPRPAEDPEGDGASTPRYPSGPFRMEPHEAARLFNLAPCDVPAEDIVVGVTSEDELLPGEVQAVPATGANRRLFPDSQLMRRDDDGHFHPATDTDVDSPAGTPLFLAVEPARPFDQVGPTIVAGIDLPNEELTWEGPAEVYPTLGPCIGAYKLGEGGVFGRLPAGFDIIAALIAAEERLGTPVDPIIGGVHHGDTGPASAEEVNSYCMWLLGSGPAERVRAAGQPERDDADGRGPRRVPPAGPGRGRPVPARRHPDSGVDGGRLPAVFAVLNGTGGREGRVTSPVANRRVAGANPVGLHPGRW
jgi:hypothetical protein